MHTKETLKKTDVQPILLGNGREQVAKPIVYKPYKALPDTIPTS